jgi:hypothetical protein
MNVCRKGLLLMSGGIAHESGSCIRPAAAGSCPTCDLGPGAHGAGLKVLMLGIHPSRKLKGRRSSAETTTQKPRSQTMLARAARVS